MDYEYKKITLTEKGERTSKDFHIFSAKLIDDPRFQIIFYFPAGPLISNLFAKADGHSDCSKMKQATAL